VSNIRKQVEINESQSVRERLLAMLALFFAVVALLLAAVGLYGVLHYSVCNAIMKLAFVWRSALKPATSPDALLRIPR